MFAWTSGYIEGKGREVHSIRSQRNEEEIAGMKLDLNNAEL
jgi:hypothetical protein